jgi:hypothetical protein
MGTFSVRHALAFFVVLFLSLATHAAAAQEPSKKACLDAHSKGQDAKEEGHLSLARKLFMTCAQPQCPGLVQSDCARYADELERALPSLTFSARDDKGKDLPDTTVYVDDQLVATSLTDGRPHEVDPGTHVVRFVNGSHESTSTIVVGSGEKARAVVATFEGPDRVATGEGEGALPAEPKTHHAMGSKILTIAGAGMVVAGGVLAVMGLKDLPSKCKLSTHECAAPPGDKSFDTAESAIRMNNVGWVVAGVGAAAVAAGLVWYVKSGKNDQEPKAVAPFVTAGGGGFVLTGRM